MIILHRLEPALTKLKNILFQQKAARTTFYADRQAHARPHLTIINSLKVYQFNIQQVLAFMQRV